MVLELEGYEVRTARNGLEAVNLLEGGLAPAVILLDMMMPVMNGPEFVSVIRTHPGMSGIPVIVLSAFTRLLQELRARGLEIQGLVEKPIDLNLLMSHIHRHCDGLG